MYKMYAVYDAKAGSFKPPYFCVNDAVAMRMFAQTVANVEELHRFPEDFQMFYLGEFDDDTGKIEPVVPEVVLTAVQALEKK